MKISRLTTTLFYSLALLATLFDSRLCFSSARDSRPKLPVSVVSMISATSLSDCPVLPGCPGGLPVPLPPFLEKQDKEMTGDASRSGSIVTGMIEGSGKYAGMLVIPSGQFLMGSSEKSGRIDERPNHDVFINDFYMAKREVTVREFCRFLNSQGENCLDGSPRIKLEDPTCPVTREGALFVSKPGYSDRPVTHVSWYGAMDYAVWAGGRLPTSAEWEKAALLTTMSPPQDNLSLPLEQASVAVNQASEGAMGVTGFAGNVWEWCHDWYQKDYYSQGGKTNPLGPPLGQEKVIRGGSWAAPEASKRIRNRHKASPRGFYRTVGFRIVKE